MRVRNEKIVHLEDKRKPGYYSCNHAVGMGHPKKLTKNKDKVTCKNCRERYLRHNKIITREDYEILYSRIESINLNHFGRLQKYIKAKRYETNALRHLAKGILCMLLIPIIYILLWINLSFFINIFLLFLIMFLFIISIYEKTMFISYIFNKPKGKLK